MRTKFDSKYKLVLLFQLYFFYTYDNKLDSLFFSSSIIVFSREDQVNLIFVFMYVSILCISYHTK